MQAAPLDFLEADEALQPEVQRTAREAGSMWTQSLLCPMLPWSAVVLVSVDDPHSVPSR